jgi:meckelin
LLFLVITEGFGYRYYALMEADLTRKPTQSPENYALNFVIIVVTIHLIGCVTLFLTQLLTPFAPPGYVGFVDLCSVANISLIMFNEDLNGYYIHGKSPSGAADVSTERLRLNIENEI